MVTNAIVTDLVITCGIISVIALSKALAINYLKLTFFITDEKFYSSTVTYSGNLSITQLSNNTLSYYLYSGVDGLYY